MSPRFLIIDPNVLSGLGLQNIIEELVPVADVYVVQSFDEIARYESEGFVHFFVASRIYFEHAQYFRNHSAKSIVMVNGDMTISGVKTINVCQSEKNLVRDIIALNHNHHGSHAAAAHPGSHAVTAHTGSHAAAAHHGSHPCAMPPHPIVDEEQSPLSAREVEVALMLCKGNISKEIAERLSISTTTVNTHRKNIMSKLHARSLVDVIIHMVRNGFIDVSEL